MLGPNICNNMISVNFTWFIQVLSICHEGPEKAAETGGAAF